VWQAVFYKARSSGSSGGGMRAAVMAAEAQTAATTSSNTTAGAAAAATVAAAAAAVAVPKRTGSADVCEHMQQFNDHKKVLEGVHEHYPKACYSDPSLRCVDTITLLLQSDVQYTVTTQLLVCQDLVV
jgi:hypothetical protein